MFRLHFAQSSFDFQKPGTGFQSAFRLVFLRREGPERILKVLQVTTHRAKAPFRSRKSRFLEALDSVLLAQIRRLAGGAKEFPEGPGKNDE